MSETAVVLVATRNALNIGAAARAMANFGVEDLRLVRPYEPSFREAVSAVGGAHVLQAARVFESVAEAVADCSLVLGTTAGQRRELKQPVEMLDEAAAGIREHRGRVAVLFGSEKFGLGNEDLSFCHLLLRIPTVDGVPSMNLGQAVAVCLYELARPVGEQVRPMRGQEPVSGAEAEQLTQMLMNLLRESGYTNRIEGVSTEQKVRRWVRRMNTSRQDAAMMMGVLRQALWKVGNSGKNLE